MGPMCVCEDGSQVEPGAVCDVIFYFHFFMYAIIHL